MKVLIIDDEKSPEVFGLKATDVTWVRTYKQAMEALRNNIWNVIYLDHDLGPGKTGYDICKHLMNREASSLPEVIYITSFNAVGRKRMRDILLQVYNECKPSGKPCVFLEISDIKF